MTREEVIKKWDRRHHTALQAVLRFVDNDNPVILFPKEDYRPLVTPQIFKDLGFYYAGRVYSAKLYPIKKDPKDIAFYKYIRKSQSI